MVSLPRSEQVHHRGQHRSHYSAVVDEVKKVQWVGKGGERQLRTYIALTEVLQYSQVVSYVARLLKTRRDLVGCDLISH